MWNPSLERKEELILEATERFQKECYNHVELIINESRSRELFNHNVPSVQDVTNTWIFRKLAELEFELIGVPERLEELELKTGA